MSQSIQVNGQTINYPETGDTNWSDDATNFAIQTSAALGKIGLSSGTSVDITQTLDVTGNTTLDANLSVGGNTTLTGNLTVNGNTQLGNANTDTIGVTGIVNVDSGVLYIDPVGRVGINDTTPSQALDVTGNALISGTLGVTGDVAINTNKFNVTASSGNTTIAGTLGISNGTALAPAITPSGDTNTGLYSIGADKIGFAANGVRQGEFGVGYGGFTGNIIQVLNTVISNTITISSASIGVFYGITGLSVNITPRYNNSRILIFANVTHSLLSTNGYCYGNVRLLRDSTLIGVGDASGNRSRATSGTQFNITGNSVNTSPLHFYDSPNTTNAINYNIQVSQTAGATGTIFINRDPTDTDAINFARYISTITVMEVQQ